MKAALIIFAFVFLAQYIWQTNEYPVHIGEPVASSDLVLAQAFENGQSNLQLEGSGKVMRVLPDDNYGSRHQRFILQLDSGQTVLVAHNIDLADRVSSLRKGDLVEFYGEYEWNPEGGVIHWTHQDPRGGHKAGWLRHQGIAYQ
jgi:hypothetical protein